MKPRSLVIAGLFVLGVLLAGTGYLLSREPPEIRVALDPASALATDTTGYARALGPRPLRFPDDHGPHPDFKLEWWYLTGNLETPDGRAFGYQFTVFRNALTPPDTSSGRASGGASDWTTRQLYMAHFTVSDIEAGRFHAFERFSRGAAGLAGAQAAPFRAWLGDWSVEQPSGTMPPLRLRAEEGGVAVDLTLALAKPIVLQGDAGYSVKGPGPGNASYYYSMTRLATEGTVTVAGRTYDVAGLSWMDREWSTSLLGPEQVGWDWFSLQLDDGRELMYFVVREQDPAAVPYRDAALIEADGTKRALDPATVSLEVRATWESPQDGAVYPAGWRIRVPGEDLDLVVTPLLANQELDVSVRYWEGAVRVEGQAGGRPVAGRGYVELTGYGTNQALQL